MLTGLAAKCESREQTGGLLQDIFIQNMRNQVFQGKLCTGTKESPEETLRFAVAFEEGVIQRKSFGSGGMIEIKTNQFVQLGAATQIGTHAQEVAPNL